MNDAGADAADPDGPQINHTPYINELEPAAWRQSGARIGKYEFYKGMTGQLSNDWVIFRYADILLTKAEALARKAGNWNDPTALALVNQIRTVHGGVTPYTTMTAQLFWMKEAGKCFLKLPGGRTRFALEHITAPLCSTLADADAHVNIFPIPESVINANNKLKQNPGY